MASEKQKVFVVKLDPSIAMEKIMPICRYKCVAVGILLIIIGVLWYLCNIGVLSHEIFWPAILVVAGIICWFKALRLHK
jgi:predicted membrane channel-forming protein YqfA (hemolysin III family)